MTGAAASWWDWPGGTSTGRGLAVLLPGRAYPATMPLLTFAGLAAQQHGWSIRAVTWEAPHGEADLGAWVGDRLLDAVADHDGPVLVGGSADPVWDRATAERVGPDVLHLEGADHACFTSGDAVGTVETHLQVIRSLDRWLATRRDR